MPTIHRLPPHEAYKIAAGEVVERPANVVKELIENAIDAHATHICVYVEDGGKKKIRIIDNGHGMTPQDARLSIEHHTTSKIRSVDDLKSIATFGFRGEALSSICAVSHVSLTTKNDAAPHGFKLEIEASSVLNESVVSSNTGTEIEIHDIFYNVPARKKFLKKRETEFNQIQHMMQAFALRYRTLHFSLFHDDRQIINCPPTDSIASRCAQLFDPARAQQMLTFDASRQGCTLQGAISNHQLFRYDRNHIFIFVNSRWVKNLGLSRALLKGYMNVLPAGRYPAAVIEIEVDPATIDVNIHPRKEEVQFLNPRIIELLLQEAVKKRLEEHVATSLKKSATQPLPHYDAPMMPPFNTSFATPPVSPQFAYQPTPQAPSFVKPSVEPSFTQVPSTHVDAQIHVQELLTPDMPTPIESAVSTYTIIGQYNTTYILLEQEDGLFLVDQHAAHERVLYELFAQRFEDVATVNLLFPQIITLTQHDVQLLSPHLQFFETNGIVLEPFSDHQLLLHATPVHIKNQSIDDLIKQMVGWIGEYQDLDTVHFTKMIHEKLRAQMACKAAVKAGDTLTIEQMQQLVDDLYKTTNRLTCPHGRPTGWLLHLTELEKKFKRRV